MNVVPIKTFFGPEMLLGVEKCTVTGCSFFPEKNIVLSSIYLQRNIFNSQALKNRTGVVKVQKGLGEN